MLNLAKETQNYSIVNIATETDALTLEVDPAKQPCVKTLTDRASSPSSTFQMNATTKLW